MVSTLRYLTPEESLELDIDFRISADAWCDIWRPLDRCDASVLACLLRFAYGRGYCDALTEADRGKLCRDHGFSVPARVRACDREESCEIWTPHGHAET